MSNATLLSRSYIGHLSDPATCALGVADKLDSIRDHRGIRMMVVVDAMEKCYASARSSTIDMMLMKGEVELIGTYTKNCPIPHISDDVYETAKEHGLMGCQTIADGYN